MHTTAHDLDACVDGSFVPYRDTNGRPRLLDLRKPSASTGNNKPEAVAMRKRLTRFLKTAIKHAREVTDSASVQRWAATYRDPFADACTECVHVLGGCLGDEGMAWRAIDDRLCKYMFARFGRLYPPEVTCTDCNGTGRDANDVRCMPCGGFGTVPPLTGLVSKNGV